MTSLHSYQKRIVKEALRELRAGRNVMIDAPTGAGKSAMVARLADRLAQDFGCRALILEDGQEVFRQMAGRTGSRQAGREESEGEVEAWLGYKPGFIGDETHGGDGQILKGRGARVTVGMVDTIRGWIRSPEPDAPAHAKGRLLADYGVVLIDEAHHTYANERSEYREVLSYLESEARKAGKRLIVVGASATPWREADGRTGYDRLDPVFDEAATVKIPFMEVYQAGRIVMPETVFADVANEHEQTARGRAPLGEIAAGSRGWRDFGASGRNAHRDLVEERRRLGRSRRRGVHEEDPVARCLGRPARHDLVRRRSGE